MVGRTAMAGSALLLLLALGSLPAGLQEQIGIKVGGGDNRVEVAVYYESLCPDSINFIRAQLAPVWPSMKQYMNIRFIPFGKSASQRMPDGTIRFRCQHGARECSGNRMQSCALSLLATQEKQTQFVTCVMTQYDPSLAGPACSEAVQLNYRDVESCYASNVGENLQLQAEADTNQIKRPLDFVPTIVFNNVFDQDKQDDSLYDFKQVLCSQISSSVPECA